MWARKRDLEQIGSQLTELCGLMRELIVVLGHRPLTPRTVSTENRPAIKTGKDVVRVTAGERLKTQQENLYKTQAPWRSPGPDSGRTPDGAERTDRANSLETR